MIPLLHVCIELIGPRLTPRTPFIKNIHHWSLTTKGRKQTVCEVYVWVERWSHGATETGAVLPLVPVISR